MRVLNIGAYDAILGYDWLKLHNPTVCHWELKTLEFKENGVQVHLQGIRQGPPNLSVISPEQFLKWHAGNEIWAMAVLQQTKEASTPVPPLITEVLQEFQDIFLYSS
jgi:hypothetical protein